MSIHKLVKARNIKTFLSQGFTIIELMVSILITLVILSGLVQVVFSSRDNAQSNDEIAFIQENARYVIDVMSRDIRHAGYTGCANNVAIANTLNTDLDGLIGPEPVIGWNRNDNDAPAGIETSLSDAFVIRRGDERREFEVRNQDRGARTIQIFGDHRFDTDEPLLIAHHNCRTAGVFGNRLSVSNAVGYGGSINCADEISGNLSCAVADGTTTVQGRSANIPYTPGSRVMGFITHAYFIEGSSINNNPLRPAVPALKRVRLVNGAPLNSQVEEIARGVERMRVLYGVDSDADGIANTYSDADTVAASDDWMNVVSLRLNLTFRSESEVYTDDEQVEFTDPIDGNIVAGSADARFIRQRVSSTIDIRNLGTL